MEVVSVAARTVKRPESILSIRGVFQPAAEISARQVLAMKRPKICATGYFNHMSKVMEDIGMRVLHKRVPYLVQHIECAVFIAKVSAKKNAPRWIKQLRAIGCWPEPEPAGASA